MSELRPHEFILVTVRPQSEKHQHPIVKCSLAVCLLCLVLNANARGYQRTLHPDFPMNSLYRQRCRERGNLNKLSLDPAPLVPDSQEMLISHIFH